MPTSEDGPIEMQAGHERPEADEQQTGLQLAELSNEMVRLYKRRFGRGPTKARACYAGPDLIALTLENSLTPMELATADAGEYERVRDARLHLQYTGKAEVVAAAERTTGRTVRAFVSGIDAEHDVASELFYLEPRR